MWNRSPVQVGYMRQVLGAGALGWPRGMGWGGMWEGGSGWGTHVNPWLIHVSVWQKPLQYCKVISLQLIKIIGEKKKDSASQCRRHRDAGLIPVLGRSPGVGNGNPLQYSCLENFMDRVAWQATIHCITKSKTWISSHNNMMIKSRESCLVWLELLNICFQWGGVCLLNINDIYC